MHIYIYTYICMEICKHVWVYIYIHKYTIYYYMWTLEKVFLVGFVASALDTGHVSLERTAFSKRRFILLPAPHAAFMSLLVLFRVVHGQFKPASNEV